jgi:hypothetical protein
MCWCTPNLRTPFCDKPNCARPLKSVQNNESSQIATACNCIGPQCGQPLCPCQMRGVSIQDGRYVRVTDLGPAKGME